MKPRPRWTRKPIKKTGRQSRNKWGRKTNNSLRKVNNALKKEHMLRKIRRNTDDDEW